MSTMPKGKEAKGTKVTLKSAKNAIQVTPQGRRRLVLRKMGITVFPKCLFKLTNVEELDLSRNQIKKLPDNIGSFSSLKWLDMHSNKLESVPESIGNLVKLTHLNLANNCLTSAGLPSSLGSLTNLNSLNLGLNQLDALPPTLERLENLQELGLFDNSFVKLPQFVTVLRNLTKLNVTRNPVTSVKEKDEEQKKNDSESKEDVYLVHESSLCQTCLQRCKAGKEWSKIEERGDCTQVSKPKKKGFPGLTTPNSVAILSQDVWRMKETGKRKKKKK